jgi:hypothetical protein
MSVSVRSYVLWKTALLALVAFLLASDFWAMTNWRRALDPKLAGELGIILAPPDAAGLRTITQFTPGSPVQAAGAGLGDRVLMDRYADTDLRRAMGVDEHIGYELHNAHGVRHVVVQPMPWHAFDPTSALISWITGWAQKLLSVGVALLIGLRRPQDLGMRALALALLNTNFHGAYFLPDGWLLEAYLKLLQPLADTVAGAGFLLFALNFPDDRPLWSKAWVRRGFVLALLPGLWVMVRKIMVVNNLALNFAADSALITGLEVSEVVFTQTLSLVALGWSWRHAQGTVRQRLSWISLSLGSLWVLTMLLSMDLSLGYNWTYTFIVFDVLSFLFICVLAWAIVRHRVFGIGFAANRALVFSIVGAALFGVLQLAQAVVVNVLHVDDKNRAVLLGAILALTVYLSFNPTRKLVEKLVDRLLFGDWVERETALKHFVKQARLVSDAGVLGKMLVAAVSNFAGGNGCALYLRRDDAGGHARAESTLANAPESLGANHETVLNMQAMEHADATRPAALPADAAVAVPMLHRGHLLGLLLVGQQPNATPYRPDQIEALEHAAHEVGLDFYRLKISQLESQLAEQQVAYDRLQAQLVTATQMAHAQPAGPASLVA